MGVARPTKRRATLPERYRDGFAWELDMRSLVGMRVSNELAGWIAHLGGEDRLAADDRVRVERVTFLTLKLREHEGSVLRGEGGTMSPEQYSAWVNSLNGLLNRIGPRRAKPAKSLRQALEAA